jgi:DNA helicase-2/ATP-dependent DNA helicase PcrA
MLLNEAQNHAVATTEGPVLIVAGAGSGKTRVIVHRILGLIKKGVAPHSILAITFTNKAAKEMRDRVWSLLNEDKGLNIPVSMVERPFVSTFHALGVHIIKENAALLGLTRHFSIYDRSDSKRAIKEAMLQAGLDQKKYDPGVFLNMISRAKGDGLNSLQYKDAAKDFVQEMAADVWEKYETILKAEHGLDFDDLLLKTAGLLERPEIREHYASVWRYIHIDEYQDTNRVQYKIVEALASAHRNLCVVGDADQNIYSWRGATIENILRFEKDYPEAAVITLETNYRSTKTILAAANAVIEKNSRRQKKTLTTDNPLGEKIALLSSYTENDEARAIADAAGGLIASGTPANEIAVLYRTNFQSRALEEAFIKKNVPYQLIGVRFFERKEIRDILSYVKAALNMGSKDGSAFPTGGWADIARIINVPPRGIGKATIAKVLAGAESSLPPTMRGKLKDFWKLLADIRQEILEKKPSEAVRFVIQETGIEQALREGNDEDEERLLNARELVTVAAQYDDRTPIPASPDTAATDQNANMTPGIEAFLENAALATDQDELTEKSADAVKLMTVHAAKGLEFDHVFISGLEQDLFPFKHLDEAEMDQDEAEEERRLFYVALTRARHKVHLSHALVRSVYGTEKVSIPSEFIEDIDRNLVEETVPEKPSGVKAIFIDF